MEAPTSATGNESDFALGHEDWAAILDPAFCRDSAAVEGLARLLFRIKKAIERGPDGVEQAGKVLLAGIESAYLYTEAYRAALKLYLLSLTGQLKPQDEPLQLINEAIKRGTIEVKLRKKKRRSSV